MPTKLEQQADLLFANMNGWEQFVLERIGKRINKIGKMNVADVQAMNNIADVKGDMKEITKELARVSGISEPRYSDKELAELKARDKRAFNIDGHEMTGYEASQTMRRLETAVREQKGIKAMAQASGDPLAVRECNERIKRYKDKYAEISDITGIAQDKKRMTLTGADKIKGTSTPKTVKSVDNSAKNDIIKSEQLKRIPQVPSSTITKKIEVGEYGTKLSKQQYQKHIKGTPQYNQYLSSRVAKGGNPQSILTISEQEAQEIILTKSGTEIVRVSRNGIPKPQEDITCDMIIGKYYGGGEYHDTKKATIHYGKQKSHIVPIKGDNYD